MQGVVRDRNTIVSVKWSGSERGAGYPEGTLLHRPLTA